MKHSVRAYLPYEIRELGWAIAEGKTDEYPFQIRCRCFPADFRKSDYAARLNVFWEMGHPLEDGLASLTDIPMMQNFEERIIRMSELNGSSVLAAVLTGRGEREFIFHAQNDGAFLNCLNGIPQEAIPYPIKIFLSNDPDWEYIRDIVGDRPYLG